MSSSTSPPGDIARVYKEIFDLNVLAVIIGSRVAAKELVKTNGSIIVTLSNSSFYPDGGGVMYIASKHAALGIVRQLAHEFAPAIRVKRRVAGRYEDRHPHACQLRTG